MLDYFALIVLLLLVGLVVAGWLLLAMWPGQIAKKRNHPQAEAINVMGWWGAITMGILAPIAWVWAYTNPNATLAGDVKSDPDLSRRSPQAKPDPDPAPDASEEVTS